jgi:hypothetical protein
MNNPFESALNFWLHLLFQDKRLEKEYHILDESQNKKTSIDYCFHRSLNDQTKVVGGDANNSSGVP